jgi:pentatricopeptide repeat protein
MRRRGVDEAWNSLEEMQRGGQTTDKYTVSRMLMKTVGDGRSRLNPARVYRVIAIVERFIELQPKDVDEVLLNALLDTCCRLKDLNRLESIMQRMRDLSITPSPVTLGILVKTYGQAGNIDRVLHVWDEMEKQRGQANAVTYGCMIDACVKCGHLNKAVEIFQGMRETGKHRNTILYTTLIKGYGLEKDLASALELFREMPREGVPYNTITYNSIIDACVKGGDLATAEALLHEITAPSSALEPDLITFSTLLKGYCHIGDLDKALQITEAIKARGLRCDELVYNTLMDGCVKANDVAAGVGLFEEMVQNGMRPSAITHSILARLYQRAGYEEDAGDAVLQLYAHHGIERPSGGGGDRSKGAGRRGGNNQRSPLGRGGATPTGSPTYGYTGNQRHGDNNWSMWGDSGYSNDHSCASTPCGSPHHSIGNSGGGLFLPLDAMRGVPPPLPGMTADQTQYGSNGTGMTPMNSAFQGSYASSPCMSPMSMEQHQTVMMSIPASPAHLQSYSNGATMPGTGSGVVPALPPFPFTGGAPGQCQSNTLGVDAQVPQFFPVQMSQPSQPVMPSAGNMMLATGTNMGSLANSMPHMNGQNAMTPGDTSQLQQSPFPMPLSPPHDMVQGACPMNQQSQQVFFENFAPEGQAVSTAASSGHQSPFCL